MPKVVFEKERCKGCGLCPEVCPRKIIKMDEELNKRGYYPAFVPVEDLEKCIGCGFCYEICPDTVITVYK